ncbi:MAG: DUF885 domain-containing protein [Candidatus Eremiobacteraeota bacterium]|nr:DUF885 domain-containing protein [Candidatus Eremiobacteraeota bacterium]
MCTIHNQPVANAKIASRPRAAETRSSAIDTVELGSTPAPEMRRPQFPQKPEWIRRSDKVTQQLLDIGFERFPEGGSSQGLSQYDEQVSVPTYANDQAYFQKLRDFKASVEASLTTESDKRVAQDLRILADSAQQTLDDEAYYEEKCVPFNNPTDSIYGSLANLLDDQNSPDRWQAAAARLKKYAGLEPGYRPMAEVFRERAELQMAKPDMIYPSRVAVENALKNDAQLLDGIQSLLEKQGVKDWQPAFAALKEQLTAYDGWLRETVLPQTREDFRLPADSYLRNFRNMGISDVSPEQLAAKGRQAFTDIQGQMQSVALQLGQTDYREALKVLKKDQIAPDQILPLYKSRLQQIEGIIREKDLVTLPPGECVIRQATPAEAAAFPSPQMIAPPLVNNNGERGQFVLPLLSPDGQKFDDFTYNAISWPVTAHEARPGHELQFDGMVDRGVSLARAVYAGNSANIEGWGLYSEWMLQPHMPLEGQLSALNSRQLRAARAFLDPELHAGKITTDQAREILSKDVGLSDSMVNSEIQRYTFRAPAQACSYFYGFDQLLSLRQDVEQKMGADFKAKDFHDFVLDQGLLPPNLLRQAVMEKFEPGGPPRA